MGKFIDLTGQKFEKISVIELHHKEKSLFGSRIYWLCKCECGNEIIKRTDDIHKIKTCGCEQGRLIDLKGKTYERLFVIEKAPHHQNEKDNSAYWKCECSCGKIVVVKGSNLRRGITKSCGCLNKEKVKEANRLDNGESAYNRIYRQYIRNAKKRNLGFELNKIQFKKLINSNCFYCNKIPSQICKGNFGDYVYNGIDRIDSLLGYTVDNCVPCCGRCNEAKMSETQSDFKSWIEKVYNHFVKGEN